MIDVEAHAERGRTTIPTHLLLKPPSKRCFMLLAVELACCWWLVDGAVRASDSLLESTKDPPRCIRFPNPEEARPSSPPYHALLYTDLHACTALHQSPCMHCCAPISSHSRCSYLPIISLGSPCCTSVGPRSSKSITIGTGRVAHLLS